jgi:hypothetical protein
MIYRGYTIRKVDNGVITWQTNKAVFSFPTEEKAMSFIDDVRRHEREQDIRGGYQDGDSFKKDMEQ